MLAMLKYVRPELIIIGPWPELAIHCHSNRKDSSSHNPQSKSMNVTSECNICLRQRASRFAEPSIPYRRVVTCCVSPTSMTAIHSEVGSRHEGTSRADEENSSPAVFARLAQLAQHVFRRPLSPTLGVLVEEFFNHLGDDISG